VAYIGRRKAKISLEFTNFVSGREANSFNSLANGRGKTSVHSFYDPEFNFYTVDRQVKINPLSVQIRHAASCIPKI
jgi:hypothetical protein